MPLGLGATKGLAFTEDWKDDINRIYQNAEQNARMQKESEQKTQYYAGLMKQTQVNIPSVDARLTDYYKGVNNELADFAIANPHFETDINGMQKFINITDKYHNNPIIAEGQQAKGEFEKLRTAVADGKIEKFQADQEFARWDKYAKEGEDPYVFSNPKNITTSDYLEADVKNTNVTQRSVLDKNTGAMGLLSKVNPVDAYRAAVARCSDPNAAPKIEKEYNALIAADPKLKSLYTSKEDYWAKRIQAGHPDEYKFESWDPIIVKQRELAMKGEGDGDISHWATDFLTKAGSIQETSGPSGTNIPYGSAPAQDIDLAMTKAGKAGESITINPSDKFLVASKKGGGIVPFGSTLSGKIISAGRMVNFGGRLYIEGTMQFNQGVETINGKPQPPNITDATLKDYGAQSSGMISETSIPNISGGTKVSTGVPYTMTVYAPVIMNKENAIRWEKEFLPGEKHMESAAPYLESHAMDLIRQNEPAMRSWVQQQYGIDTKPVLPQIRFQDETGATIEGKNLRIANVKGVETYVDISTGKTYPVGK